jgi:hypothetical protein
MNLLKRLFNNEIVIKGYHLNLMLAIYFFFFAAFLKDSIISGEINYYFGTLGFLIYFLEVKFIKIKTLFVLKRAEKYYLTVIKKHNPDAKQKRIGGFLWYMNFVRFLFRIGIIVISGHLFGLDEYGKDNGMGWIGGLVLGVFIIYELITLMIFMDLSGAMIIKEEDAIKNKKKVNDKWNKMHQNKFWLLRSEGVSDFVLFIYSGMLFTAFWDIMSTEMISEVEGFYSNGHSIYFALAAVISLYSLLCFLAVVPIRLAYWIEESLMAYSTKQKLALYASFFLVCLSLCYPPLFRIVELYILESKVF